MKTQILILALFIMPFFSYSQQTVNNNKGMKKETQVVVIKKTIQADRIHSHRTSYKYSEEYRKANNIPDDFPHYINTGNTKQDANVYYEAKQLWIKNNPTRFEKIKSIAL